MAQSQFTTFYIDDSLYGIDVRYVREINRNTDITPVELAPPYVRGLLNLRGQIVTILDCAVRIGLPVKDVLSTSRCIVLKTSDESKKSGATDTDEMSGAHDIIGLLIDKIGDMVIVDEEAIEPPPANSGGVDGKYIQGVVKLEKELLVVLRLREILSHDSV